jgi:3-dehydroquinate synthase
MKVRVHLKSTVDHSYDIEFDKNLSEVAREIRKEYSSSRIFIITDTNVKKLYAEQFARALSTKRSPAHLLAVPAGEKSKSRRTKERLEDELIQRGAGRDSLIVALGGGMVGDLAGFVASTLFRGIPFIQIPTTLLSQVDSSIGGKVAVDHPLGKNLIGAFYQPKKVYIDPITLKTLHDREFRCGMAEVIKYAAILDAKFFRYLENNIKSVMKRDLPTLRKIIKRCCELKGMIVEKDERETGLRRILNFGHTIGHAIELQAHYHIAHGEAVAIGMAAEAKISVSLGMLSSRDEYRLLRLLSAYCPPTKLQSSLNIDNIFAATRRDKKNVGGVVHYTLLSGIGKARVGIPLTVEEGMRLLQQ